MERRLYNILVVDDSHDDFLLTRRLFQKIATARFNVDWVETFSQATDAIRERKHDFYFIDYRLGAQSGLDLIRAAMSSGCSAPMIVLSSYQDHAIDVEAEEAGATDFLIKGSVTPEILERCMRYCAARFRADLAVKRNQEEQRERASLLDLVPDAILVRDLQDRILYWSKGAEDIYGYTAKEALGCKVTDLVFRDAEVFKNAQAELLRTGEWSGELKQQTKIGVAIAVSSRWTLVRDEAGRPKSVLSINTDITERRQLESRLLRVQRLEGIGTLAGGIAHDLNNILAPILLTTPMLRTNLPPEDLEETISTIESSAQRGAEIVRQLLTFGRGIEGNRVMVQLGHLILDTVKIARSTFPKTITVSYHLPRELKTVMGDATQLHQVILNLCVNARDAMPSGGTLTLQAENIVLDPNYTAMNPEAREGAYVLLKVKDTGCGMPPEIVDKIFDPFFTTKPPGHGTGLGLSTLLGIVKSHGGFVGVHSKVGLGTTFEVYLPAIPSPGRDLTPVEVDTPFIGRGETILVVDDEINVREATRRTLKANGYEVLVAADGTEAVAIYVQNREKIAVVLTDLVMPYLDGSSLVRVLKRINSNVRVITSSGAGSNRGPQDKAEELRGLGVTVFLSKPFTAEQLLRPLRDLIDRTE